MRTPTPLRTLPGAPRAVLPVLLLGGSVLVCSPLLPPAAAGAVSAAAVLVTCAAAWWAVAWRARLRGAEQRVWSSFRHAATAYLAAAALACAPPLAAAAGARWPAELPAGAAQVPLAAAALVSFPLTYRALVRWNRHSASGADPDDLLNGLSSVLVLTAVLQSVGGGGGAGAPGWLVELLLARDASVVVLALTAVTAVRLSALRTDPRTWLVAGGLAVAGAGTLAARAGVGVPDALSGLLWTAGLACLCAAALLRVRSAPTEGAAPAASTVGAFVVVLGALAVVVADVLADRSATAVLCAAAAVLGASTRLLINLRDLVQLAASRREALTDDLTGTANRRAVLRRLDEHLAAGTAGAVAVLDVARFKEVNDALGHAAGDELLRMIAQRVQPGLGPGALFGRLGGDEFAVVQPCGPGEEPPAARLGAHLLAVLAEPFPLTAMDVHVGVSVGLTSWTAAGTAAGAGGAAGGAEVDAEALLRQAHGALSDAQRTGAGTVHHDPARHGDTRGLLALAEDLRRGVEGGQLVLHYQPQLDVASGAVAGVEALVRWQHPVLGLLGPGRFVPLAEAHGLMGAVTARVLRDAVAQAAAWWGAGVHLRVSVNLSASDLLDTGLPARVAALLAAHRLPASALVLEVTESVLLREPERSVAVVAALRAQGVQVSIDDFGTGYSSLTQLRRLPVTELKLDRSFTTDLLHDPAAAAIVASTVGLAHALGLRVVAEGVEDPATLARLSALGCDETQGYLHARPLEPSALLAWLGRRAGVPAPAS
ncbi:putative bifunctional diguanylate cyclase/phosphodiesterase [Kineococcus sp. SYSU DK005]|uniref:putative bifunctional diguanylate cyclase/phosphodiesterase n=1 Tax=Kineococcus sp. SYSU DK005 TaxID=3383126 RepID=UPI003D7E363D